MGVASSIPQKSIHEFIVKDSKGKDVDLSIYKGKVLLVVNVASKCGFTKANYPKLTELYSKYNSKGREILAFPCNQFLKQEPESSEKIEEFACKTFNSEFPILHKVRVNGPNAAPVCTSFLKQVKGLYSGLASNGILPSFWLTKKAGL